MAVTVLTRRSTVCNDVLLIITRPISLGDANSVLMVVIIVLVPLSAFHATPDTSSLWDSV